jgi:hypothetical protein
MSRYLGGQTDKQRLRKPFRNIGNAIVHIEWRGELNSCNLLRFSRTALGWIGSFGTAEDPGD